MIFMHALAKGNAQNFGLKFTLTLTLTMGLCAVLLASCASSQQPSTELKVLEVTELNLPHFSTQDIQPEWWERFQNKSLSELIESSLKNNPSIALANTRIEKAQALASITQAESSFQGGGALNLDRQRFSQTGIYPPPLGGSVQSLTTLQLSGAWIPDVFGKYKAAYASAMGQVQASALEATHARVQLSAQITLQFIALALSIDERDLLTQRQLRLQSLGHLLKERILAGLDASLDIQTHDIELNDLSIELSQLETRIDLHRHLLATLGARSPLALADLTPHLRDLNSTDLDAHLGIDLLGRRADVMAAKFRVLASMKSVEAAKLDFYPNLNLGVFAGFNSLQINQLTQNASAQYGLVPSLSLPIFDGGRLNAQLSAKNAEKDQAVALYNSTLLDALKEASDALVTYKHTSTELKSSQRSLKLAAEKLNLQSLKTQAGLSNQAAVLRESLAQLQQQRASFGGLAKQLTSEVLLIKSLGAAWPSTDTRKNAFALQP